MTDKERRRRKENDLRRLRAISTIVSLGRHRNTPTPTPTPTVVAAADWRIRSDYTYFGSAQGANNNYWSVAELELRATVGGAAQAPTSSSASSTYNNDTVGYGPANAFDGSNASIWNSAVINGMPASGAFLIATYASPVTVRQIALTAGSGATETPRYLYVEYSTDGRATWTTLYTNLAVPTWTSGAQKLFTVQ